MSDFETTYENFDIHILKVENGYGINAESKAGETVRTTVQSLPGGEDFTDAEYFLRELMGSDRDAQLFGEKIYDFLFSPDVKSLFDKSFGHAKERGNGLRIRLRLKADQPALSRIPWEYCRNKKDSYFALDRKTPLVRYLHLDEPPLPINMPDTIRVLFVTANPKDTVELDIEAEETHMRNALKPLLENGRVQLEPLHKATRKKLSAAIQQFKPHIIHFSGHGSVTKDEQSLLWLEDDQGKASAVDAEALNILFNGSGIQLVILNACQTADHNENAVFFGVAQGMLRAGIPAAIGMQFNVPDNVSHTFTEVLYQQLVDSVPLDKAVTEARISIRFNHDGTSYWGIPALFMRADDGVLWDSSFLDEIKQLFEKETTQTLENIKIELTGIGELPRNGVVDSIESQLKTHRQVLLFGNAGSGKSGVAKKLVESGQKSQRLVLLLDARNVSDIKSSSELGKYFNFDADLLQAITKIADYKHCRIIIDQFDNVIGSSSAMLLTKLALGFCKIPNVEVILISRQNRFFSRSVEVNDLLESGFVQQKCDELDDGTVLDIFSELKLPDPSDELINLAKNLLNLEIISQIKHHYKNADFSNITNTIVLWELYLKTIARREATIQGGDYADEIIIEATRLAQESMKNGKSEFVLAPPINKHQRRLIGTMLTELHGQVYRFFHEEFQYFLYARNATDEGKMPQEVFEEIGYLVKNVLLWMKNLYSQLSSNSTYDNEIYQRFLSEAFNNNEQIFFYIETDLLDQFINSTNPSADPIALNAILELLNKREDLRTYFFASKPNFAWAESLWENGFFDTPPLPEERDGGSFMPWWDVQQFLISVAHQVPHIAIKHAETIDAHPVYLSQAILALTAVPTDQLASVIPRIIQWLEDTQIAPTIAHNTFDLIKHLAKQSDEANALLLFEALTRPIPAQNGQRPEAKPRYRNVIRREDPYLAKIKWVFAESSFIKVTTILENHLRLALKLEAETTGRSDNEFKSWWRIAIEETDQDLHKDFKDHLLESLRDIYEKLALNEESFVADQIIRLLEDKHEILCRLALHLLNQFPEQFSDTVNQVLSNSSNLNDIGIRHEIFVLLQKGYPVLARTEKENLLREIKSGPPLEDVNQLALRVEQNYGEDPKEYAKAYSKRWIRDRLWMVKDYLNRSEISLLDELTDELGEPDHPAFTRLISSRSYGVQETSPLADIHLAKMSPDDLVNYVCTWEPDENAIWGPEHISYEGLANEVSNLILSNPKKYQSSLLAIATSRPVFAETIFRQFANHEQPFVSWDITIPFIENLLKYSVEDHDVNIKIDESWVGVRRGIIRLLMTGYENKTRTLPFELLDRVNNILFILVHDPSPKPEEDYPKEGWFGYKDPITLSINHVRPMALITLLEYSRYRSKLIKGMETELEHKELAPGVKDVLSRKLDRVEDPSWSVHSVYGRYLHLLDWFEPEWVKENIERIFPQKSDAESDIYFIAAWDSFVIFNHYDKALSEIMRPKYIQAIHYLEKGFKTQTDFTDPVQALARHMGQEYINSDYNIYTPAGQDSLLLMFYQGAPPEACGQLAWWLWRVCEGEELNKTYWKRIRSLWEWRMQQAAIADYSTTFDKEMEWFAHIPKAVTKYETIESMWDLMIDLIPFTTRNESYSDGWNAIEKFLAEEVARFPKQVAHFYRLMYEKWPKNRNFHNRAEVKTIIETAAQNDEAKQEVLTLIDTMARRKIFNYKYIYDELSTIK